MGKYQQTNWCQYLINLILELILKQGYSMSWRIKDIYIYVYSKKVARIKREEIWGKEVRKSTIEASAIKGNRWESRMPYKRLSINNED